MKHWEEITTVEQWEELLKSSADKPVLLLKHSTRCPVSTNALNEFNDYLDAQDELTVNPILVKVIESRPVSNRIAEDLSVEHASPQIMLIKDQSAYWNASHWAVTKEHITAVVN